MPRITYLFAPRILSWTLTAGLFAASCLLLSSGRDLPIGPAYRDLVMFLDGNLRMASGQLPHRDFFVPFGPVALYLYHWTTGLFPSSQPVLAAQYSALWCALPVMLVTCARLNSARACGALWATFALTALLPANFATFPEPFASGGASGFGVYNRQAGILLFALVTTLFWSNQRVMNAVALTALFTVLALIKITAAVFVVPLLIWAVMAGRADMKAMGWTLAACIALASVVEANTSLVSGYASDILTMAEAGQGSALARIADTLMVNAAVVLFLLVMVLAYMSTAAPSTPEHVLRTRRAWEGLKSPVLGLGLAVGSAVLIESQNTGSQAFAFLVPAALWVVFASRDRGVLLVSVAAMGFVGLTVGQAAARHVWVGAAVIEQPEVPELRSTPLRVLASRDDQRAARSWLNFYAVPERAAADELLSGGLQTSFGSAAMYRTDEQLSFLLSAADAAEEIQRLESRLGSSIGTVATLDFVDPVSILLARASVRGLPVVMDPDRMESPRMRARVLASLEQAGALLVHRCSAWRWYGDRYREMAAPVLATRVEVELNPCWTAHVPDDNFMGVAPP